MKEAFLQGGLFGDSPFFHLEKFQFVLAIIQIPYLFVARRAATGHWTQKVFVGIIESKETHEDNSVGLLYREIKHQMQWS